MPESSASRAYHTLERLIVTLELAPATITTEGALIERLGFGRTPVREAIQRLAWEGLILVRPRIGLEIAPLDPADWPRVLEARRGTEIVLARSAARLMTRPMEERFQSAAIRMHDAVLAKDLTGFLEADKALDAALADVTDNRFAARLAAPLQTHSRRFWYRYQTPNGLAESAAGHVAVIQAILSRNPHTAGMETGRLMDLLTRHAESIAAMNA
ncbi:GntR family transcriptional regulator [Salmonella enterica subsp. enterica]|nr:GntR family transcriptional regulator [Salmonella enterica subsp. enterica serovar Paratyphi A]